jgi:hypothetical protein
MSEQRELRPCPFCGHPAEHNNVKGNKLVKCTNQYCINTICTWPEIVWNYRPIEDALQARIAELELILAADKLIEDGWIGRIEAGDKRIAELEAENAKLRASAVMWHKYPDEEPEPEPKPKPLLADAKVGWICRHRNGAYSQIGGIDYPCPVTDCISIGKNRYDRDGKHSGEDMRLNPNPDLDIIHTEPLDPIGSAGWAGQMLKLGCPVKHDSFNDYQEKRGLDEVAFHTSTITSPIDSWIHNVPKTGWQLYEPEPESESNPHDFKVGDWVEYSDGTLQQAIIEAYSGQPGEQMVYVWHPQTAHSAKTPLQFITRKLDPSEVKVKVTLAGTVESRASATSFFHLRYGDGVMDWASIDLRHLNPDDRKLVESLLKAQEEK